MGITDFLKRGVSSMMIARPDWAKDYAIYKHPDKTVETCAQLTVEPDEMAIFFRDGKVAGSLGQGRHTLQSSNIPFLSNLIDSFTGGNVFISEVFFVTTRLFTGIKFGGRIGAIKDPESGMMCELLVHGEFEMRIVNPEQLIIGMVGVQQVDNESFFHWFKQHLLKVIRDRSAELVVKKDWPLLKVTSGAYTEEIADEVIAGVRQYVDNYGVEISQIGNFVISMSDESKADIKEVLKDMQHIKMAGGNMAGYQQLAAGKAMMGAGKGMEKGGGGGGDGGMLGGAALGVGFGMANMFQQNAMYQQAAMQQPQMQQPQMQQPSQNYAGAASAPAAPGGVTCPGCSATVPPGKFCSECGTPLPAPGASGPKFCNGCGGKLEPGAKFCPECGNKIG